MENKKTLTINFPFFTILFLIFLVLKLTNVISWSWWIVFLPLYWWIPVVLIILLFLWFID